MTKKNRRTPARPTRSRKLVIALAAVIIVGAVAAFVVSYTATPQTKSKNYRAALETSLGGIEIELYADKAPVTVDNFVSLARSGFYDGTLFHRVVPDFVIQGGDPNTKTGDRSLWGIGGSGRTIPLEKNSLQNVRGMVAMARSQDPNSASSQFYILVGDAHFLDGQYAVFGKVVAGMDVVDKIANLPRDDRDIPKENVVIKSITISEQP